MKLSRREVLLLDAEGFNQLFDEAVAQFSNYRIAYEALETERLELCGKRLYADYGSFKSSRSKFLKRKRKLPSTTTIENNTR